MSAYHVQSSLYATLFPQTLGDKNHCYYWNFIDEKNQSLGTKSLT